MKSLTPRWNPRKYQNDCVNQGLKQNYLAFFLDPGLGKTTILLQIFNKRKIRKQTKAALVIAPLNPAYMTWPEEIKNWTNFRRFKYSILHGRDKNFAFNRKADIYITTPDSLPWLISKLKGVHRKNWPFDTLIVDESSKFKTHSSARSKNIKKFVPGFKYRYIANGTPVGNGYMGLMSQMYIVDQGQSLGAKIGEYRAKYFDQHGKPEWGIYKLKPGGDTQIMKRISKYCICLRAEDHIDMPKEITRKIYVNIPKIAMKAYEEIESELFTMIDAHELVAESASSLATKLHQLCGGSIYEDQDPLAKPIPADKRNVIQVHKEKLLALDDLMEEINGKQLLIGYKFRHEKKALQAHFKKRIHFFEDYSGKGQKVLLQKKWNQGLIENLAGNPQSLGLGLNLQKGHAHHICLYSIDHDYEALDQFIRRLRRSGNASDAIYIHYILAKGLYDDQVVYPSLITKGNTQDKFYDYLKAYRRSRQPKK